MPMRNLFTKESDFVGYVWPSRLIPPDSGRPARQTQTHPVFAGDVVTDPHHFVLIEMLAMEATASEHGCGLEPRLLEMLFDRHAQHPGTIPRGRPIRHDGPVIAAPSQRVHHVTS